MRKVYWRPKAVSRTALILISGFAVAALILVESFPVVTRHPYQLEKMAAAEQAEQAMATIHDARLATGIPIDPTTDPTESGMIGIAMSPVTSISGSLISKQTSVNPNFAAVIVDMLKKIEVKEGDVVAVGMSGSFPALNICTISAVETLKLNPIVISSGAASQWGANVPDLLWLDMERILGESGIIATQSVAASVGGYEDRGLGMSEEGIALINKAIERNGLKRLASESFESSVDERMDLYQEMAKGKPIKAYINIGGGTVSVGRSLGKKLVYSGLNTSASLKVHRVKGVMPQFMSDGIPVIHLVQIVTLAERYGLTVQPQTFPEIGEAAVFVGEQYNRWLAVALLLIEIAVLYVFIRSDIGFRLLKSRQIPKSESAPEPMV